jgi:hypothetical protein
MMNKRYIAVEESSDYRRKDRLRAWLRAKKKNKKTGLAAGIPWFPVDELKEIWVAHVARSKSI